MTTISISHRTKRVLDHLKKKRNKSSYDKVIQEVLRRKLKFRVPRSMAGIFPDLKWTKDGKQG